VPSVSVIIDTSSATQTVDATIARPSTEFVPTLGTGDPSNSAILNVE
jgi:hypothetical protein